MSRCEAFANEWQEFDSPWNLIKAKGTFYEMVQQTGESEVLEEVSKRAAGIEEDLITM